MDSGTKADGQAPRHKLPRASLSGWSCGLRVCLAQLQFVRLNLRHSSLVSPVSLFAIIDAFAFARLYRTAWPCLPTPCNPKRRQPRAPTTFRSAFLENTYTSQVI